MTLFLLVSEPILGAMKKRPSILKVLLLLVPLVAVQPASAKGKNLYRYTNDEGNIVVDYQVPPEYVKKGYEVLSSEGVVLRVVPRELSAEERKIADAQERLEAEARAEEQRLREWDETLLRRYSTIEDIEAARERALMDLRIRVSILKGNKRSLKQQVENYQAQAAELERMGQQVDMARLSAIDDLQSEIATTDRSIRDREQEIKDVSAAYDADIQRFEALLELVAFRRAMLVQERKRHDDPRR